MAVAQDPNSVSAAKPATGYVYAVGYLRAIVVVLVVAHHSVLAYHPFAPPPSSSLTAEPRWWPAFPVVEPERWSGFGAFAGFNDLYLMALLFFVSGLLVQDSLERKGSFAFLGARLRRLGLPFVFGVGILVPLAYFPAYLQITGGGTIAGFWREWSALREWPSGPMWFLWVLLVFDAVAALLRLFARGWAESLGRLSSKMAQAPIAFFALLAGCSAAAYVPLRLVYHPLEWTMIGPLAFQTTRILHYLAYFLIGVGVGAYGLRRGLLDPDGKLARRSSLWIAVAFSLLGLSAVAAGAAAETGSPLWEATGAAGFVLTCAASTLAFLAVFLRYVRTSSRALDSLTASSYAIYLVHYPIANWLQYALLGLAMPVIVKGALATFGALGLSLGAAVAARRIPVVARLV